MNAPHTHRVEVKKKTTVLNCVVHICAHLHKWQIDKQRINKCGHLTPRQTVCEPLLLFQWNEQTQANFQKQTHSRHRIMSSGIGQTRLVRSGNASVSWNLLVFGGFGWVLWMSKFEQSYRFLYRPPLLCSCIFNAHSKCSLLCKRCTLYRILAGSFRLTLIAFRFHCFPEFVRDRILFSNFKSKSINRE